MACPTPPRVTVVVTTHNRPALLRRCLASLADQTFTDFDVVVVNDGGVDVSSARAEFPTLALEVVQHPVNRGRCAAYNTGIARARGRYVCIINDDDRYYPHHLATVVPAIEALGSGHAVYSHAVLVVENDAGEALDRKVTGAQPFDLAVLAVTNFICAMTALVPTEDLRAVGGFDTAIDVLEDWEMWLRLTHRLEWHHVDVPTAEYRMRVGHGNSTTREFFRFHPALQYVYAKHPLPPGSPLEQPRQQMLANSAGRVEAFGYDVTVAVACDGGPEETVATIEAATSLLRDASYEVLLLVPTTAEWGRLAEALPCDVQLYAVGSGDERSAWDLARRRHGGRHVLLLRSGERPDPRRVAEALRAPPGTATRVGTGRAAAVEPARAS